MCATESERLSAYRAKRSGSRTPEPFGTIVPTSGRLFVVQHHAARRPHYDLRLEMDGVLRSWAVPKGPSPNPADKRLAVQVEDHPLEYANFEGRIPEGNYGAGASIIWDRGAWIPSDDPRKGLENGKLLFELRGYKLRGKWTLIKTRRGPKDWLLIKERDAWGDEKDTEVFPADSILSGLTVDELKSGIDPAKRILRELKRLKAREQSIPAKKIEVMLAQTKTPFSKPGWVFEIKYDGYRLVGAREKGIAALYSRAGNDLTATFPEIANAIGALPYEHVIIDGEVVVHDENGMPSFSRLQKRGRLTRRYDIQRAAVELSATFYAFDLLAFEGYDLRPLPLKTRKTLLKKVLPSVGLVRYCDHIEQQGEAMYEQVRAMRLEGVIAKRAASSYVGGRSSDWVKFKVERTDDFAVVGYTDPKGTQPGFGALLLAQRSNDHWVYAGRVGTGFSTKQLEEISVELRSTAPGYAPSAAPDMVGIHWVEPALVCEVKFREITPDGLLRHPVFLRMRDDRSVTECTRRAAELSEPSTAEPDQPERVVPFSNLDKIFWPDEGYTKGDLIAYYRGIAEWLLPYLKDRPVVLTRYPDGIEGKSFFQKNAPRSVPEWVRIERLWSEGSQREISYFIVEDTETLLYIANMASIPLHIWSSRVQSLEQPDWCILDLDPKGAPFKHVVMIAEAIRALCNDIDLPCFVKTSGSTGLHVLIPLGRAYTYEQSRSLGELLARVIVGKLPNIATVVRSLDGREGRVYVDYLQNGHGQLLVAPFSVRSLPSAPVSMPLKWREVTSKLAIRRYTIKNAKKRMRSLKTDPLRDVLDLGPDLNAALDCLTAHYS